SQVSLRFYLIFFFQAEDGIRDGHVTGVQTCALPISEAVETSAREAIKKGNAVLDAIGKLDRKKVIFQNTVVALDDLAYEVNNVRSEERRVGKECRSRWSTYQ